MKSLFRLTGKQPRRQKKDKYLQNIFGTSPYKLARKDSPPTSKASAHSVDSAGKERLVYEYILSTGERGCISSDVINAFPELPYSTITARFSALKRKELIFVTGEKRKGDSGRYMQVMRANAIANNN